MEPVAAQLGLEPVFLPGLQREISPIHDAGSVRRLVRLIREFRPHVVHTHTAKAGTLGRLAALVRHVPVTVHTFHGTVFEGTFPPPFGTVIASFESLLSRYTTKVLTLSPALVEDLERRRIGRGKIGVVPLGLELDRFLDVPAIDALPPHVVTLVARLATVKNIPLFLDAVKLVKARVPDLEVRLAGDGPLRPRLEAEAPPWVTFLGHTADLPGLLRETGVVALSSRSEGTPVAFMEALTAARPVVAVPAAGGVVDILRDRPGAIVTAAATPSALAEGIIEALEDPSYANGAVSGRHKLIDEFGVDRLLSDVEQLYEELWSEYRRRDVRNRPTRRP